MVRASPEFAAIRCSRIPGRLFPLALRPLAVRPKASPAWASPGPLGRSDRPLELLAKRHPISTRTRAIAAFFTVWGEMWRRPSDQVISGLGD